MTTGNGTDNQGDRIKGTSLNGRKSLCCLIDIGYALFAQNTTVNGSWIETIDTKEKSKQYNRVINNVTLAMPHTGIFQAARDPKSEIMQPEDLDGIGTYNIIASLPSPYINVLCAHVTQKEIGKIVYSTASNNVTLNATTDLPTAYTYNFNFTNFSKVRTPVDDIFGWSEEKPPPIFYKFPTPFNTILNNTMPWGRDSIYLLGAGGSGMESTGRGEYLLCSIKGGMTPKCSTTYNAIGKSGEMASNCEELKDVHAYNRLNSSRATTTSLDWVNVATLGFTALSLNNGVTDGAASNARLLMQLMLQKMELNPSMPSPAEALAVMGGSMLLMSAQDSPFVEFWNYTSTLLDPGEYQQFDTILRAQQFASGGSPGYQRGFHVVLLAVFLLNLFVLTYLIVNRGLVTDFSEPPNLFSLTINSPPNRLMKGSCGAGPEGRQFAIKWGVEMESEHLYITDKQNRYPIVQPEGNMRGGSGSGSWFSNILRRRGNGGKYQTTASEVELGENTAYHGHPPPLGAYQTPYGGSTEYAPTTHMGVPVTYQDGQATYAGTSTQAQAGSQQQQEEDDDIDTPLKSVKSDKKEANISRMFSKIAKRKSHL
jgi:hypothetical protein